jgi:prepilin-type N-terminal cleavage/methylation domain-containing protein
MAACIPWILLRKSRKHPLRRIYGTKIAMNCAIMRLSFASRIIRAKSGFTLVELVVVTTILAVILIVGIPTYHLTIKPTAHLNGAARQLHSDIQLARLRAVSGNIRCGVAFTGGLSYILFRDDNPANSQFEYTDDGDDTNDEEVIKTVNLADAFLGVQLDTSEGGGDGISFVNNSFAMTPRGVPTIGGTVYLKNEKGEGRKIVVNNMGGVRLKKY